MSADRYTICPNCKATRNAERDELIIAAAKAYGNMLAEEWKAFDAEAHKEVVLKETVRQDYEVFLDEDGRFYLDFYGQCSVCDWGHRHKIDIHLTNAARPEA